MKRISPLAGIILMAFLSLGFILPAEWYLFETPDYSVEFPKKPETTVQNVPSDIGDLKLNISMYDASKGGDDNYVYGAYTTEYPDSLINSYKSDKISIFFRGAIDGAVKNVQGKLLSEKEIQMDGFPGREFRVDYQNGLAIILMRMYLVRNKLILLQVITDTKKENNTSELKFLESFKLKKLSKS